MTQPYLGEVRMFAGNFAPKGNALANGQLMSIVQNSALFSLLGTNFGGNGVNTFALPDMRGRVAVGFGQGLGLSSYSLGEVGGFESVTLTVSEIPIHSHNFVAASTGASSNTPNGFVPANLDPAYTGLYFPANLFNGQTSQFNASVIPPTGGNQSHENRMPILAINYIVALQGIFPSRN